MISKLIEYGLMALAAVVALWWFNDRIEAHYQAPLIAKHEAAEKEAVQLKAKRESGNDKLIESAKDARIKKLETLGADALRVSAANDRLQNDLRASRAFETDLAACVQRANTLDTIQRTVGDFAGRVAKAADGHVIDKEALTAAWPK
jgi:hypothetical protein